MLHSGFISAARTILGTTSMLLVTSAAAYAMSDRELVGHKVLWKYFLVPMFIGGGMIPSYLLMQWLGLTRTFWIYVIPGLLTLMLLCPLAVTSTVGWRRRLGPSWQRLHYLVYLAAILDVVHLYWSRKEPGDALRYAVAVGALLAMRVPPVTAALHWLREKLTAHPYAGKNRRR